MKRKVSFIGISFLIVVAMAAVYIKGQYDASNGKGLQIIDRAEAAGGVVKDSNEVAPDRYVYAG